MFWRSLSNGHFAPVGALFAVTTFFCSDGKFPLEGQPKFDPRGGLCISAVTCHEWEASRAETWVSILKKSESTVRAIAGLRGRPVLPNSASGEPGPAPRNGIPALFFGDHQERPTSDSGRTGPAWLSPRRRVRLLRIVALLEARAHSRMLPEVQSSPCTQTGARKSRARSARPIRMSNPRGQQAKYL